LRFFLSIRRGLYVHPGDVEVRKQFAYVGNVVGQMLKLLTASSDDCAGSMFYVGDYSAYIVRDWADLIQRELGAGRIRTMPLPVLKIIAAAGDAIAYFGWRRVPLTSFRLANMLTNNPLPFETTAHVCGALEYSVTDGVQRTVAWINDQGF
jgi:nucleoside-diphosphate-sugar epimerase